MTTAYLAPEGLEPKLQEELRRAGVTVQAEHGRLLIADQAVPSAWAANIWHDCIELAGRLDRHGRQGVCATSSAIGRCMRRCITAVPR